VVGREWTDSAGSRGGRRGPGGRARTAQQHRPLPAARQPKVAQPVAPPQPPLQAREQAGGLAAIVRGRPAGGAHGARALPPRGRRRQGRVADQSTLRRFSGREDCARQRAARGRRSGGGGGGDCALSSLRDGQGTAPLGAKRRLARRRKQARRVRACAAGERARAEVMRAEWWSFGFRTAISHHRAQQGTRPHSAAPAVRSPGCARGPSTAGGPGRAERARGETCVSAAAASRPASSRPLAQRAQNAGH